MSNGAYLIHHGIKGQKWGIKNGPPYPLGGDSKPRIKKSNSIGKPRIRTDSKGNTIFEKGFTFNRVGADHVDVNQSGSLYVSHGKEDADRYVKNLGPTTLRKIFGVASYYDQRLSAKGPIKMPDESTTVKMVGEALKKNKKFRHDTEQSFTAGAFDIGDITDKDIDGMIYSPTSKRSRRLAFTAVHLYGDPDYEDDAKFLASEFRKAGYDAIMDLADRMGGTSKTATIIINPEKVEIKSIERITKEVMAEAKQRVRQYEKLKLDDVLDTDLDDD